MAHLITERDIQAGLTNAWHSLTTIVDEVTRENSMPWEVVETPIMYKTTRVDPQGYSEDVYIEDPEFKRLLASDDFLPVGDPYSDSYHPSSITGFWEVIKQGMGDTPYQIISAGTVDNRQKVFASLKVSDGFRIGDREFKDFISIVDSFDRSYALQARYTNVCIVCANTLSTAMKSGNEIGKAKHTALIELNTQRLINSIDAFVGTSAAFQAMLQTAHDTPCSRDEARAWLTGIEGRNTARMTNGMLQKTARMVELFDGGRGNQGRTRLDAFSALTDLYSNESSNRKDPGAQEQSSNWGAGAQVKTMVAQTFEADWDGFVKKGSRLLEQGKTALPA